LKKAVQWFELVALFLEAESDFSSNLINQHINYGRS